MSAISNKLAVTQIHWTGIILMVALSSVDVFFASSASSLPPSPPVALLATVPYMSANDTIRCTSQQAFGVILCPDTLKISGQVSRNTSDSYPGSFKIVNPGNATLQLGNIAADPPLQIAPPTNDPIKPGDTVLVEVSFLPHVPEKVCGNVSIPLKNLQTNEDSVVHLPYCRTGLAPLLAVDRDTINFGAVAFGGSKKEKLYLNNVGTDTLTICCLYLDTAGSDAFSLTSYEPLPLRIRPGRYDSLCVQYTPTSTYTVQKGSFRIVSNSYNTPCPDTTANACRNAEERVTITLLGSGFRGAGIAFEPSAIMFDTCVGTTDTISVKLSNTGLDDTLRVSRIDTPDPESLPSPITQPIDIAPQADTTLYFVFKPQREGSISGRYVVHSNRRGGDSTLVVEAIARTSSFRVAPTQALLDTLVAVAGETVEAPFYIDNASDCPLFIDSTTVEPKTAPFDLTWKEDTTVAGPGQITIGVKYEPDTVQIDNAKILVHGKYFNAPQEFLVVGKGLLGAFASVSPDTLDFGEVCVGKDSSREVRVRNRGHKAFAIDTITATGSEAFRLIPTPSSKEAITIGAQGEHVFVITYAPTADAIDSATFTFSAPVANGEKTLRVRGRGMAAKLKANTSSLSFGNVALSKDSCRTIRWQNRSNQPITITDVEIIPADGFEASFAHDTTIAPDSSFALEVCFKPLMPKEYNKARLVLDQTADCANDTIPLFGAGCAPQIADDAPTSWEFRVVDTGMKKIDTLPLTNAGCSPWEIDSIFVKSGGTIFTVQPTADTVDANADLLLEITFAPLADTAYQDSLIILSKAWQKPRIAIALSGTGRVPSRFCASASILNFGSICAGEETTQTFTVTNCGGDTLRVQDIQWQREPVYFVKLRNFVLGKNSMQTISVSFRPGGDTGDFPDTLSFKTNLATPITLPLQAHAERYVLASSKSALDFGEVRLDTFATHAITFTNRGSKPITIHEFNILPDEGVFTLSPRADTTIAPDSSFALEICFKPLMPQPYPATLVIEHDTDCADNTISLSGTGCAPELVGEFREIPFVTIDNCSSATKDTIVVFKCVFR